MFGQLHLSINRNIDAEALQVDKADLIHGAPVYFLAPSF